MPAGGAHHLDGVQGQGHIEAVALGQQGPPPDTCQYCWILEIQLVLRFHVRLALISFAGTRIC